ncbi:hypothetical protein Misp06_04383 [Microbulbifer sp. NBRC 101763]|uniref:hypothetical protein n=1 Tax=Microbulbifer sp. NBRC 101763 TaxID=1113820 RepID=UPI0030B07616
MKKLVFIVFGFLFSLEVAAVSSGFVDISDNKIQLINGSGTSRLLVYGVTMSGTTCTNTDVPILFFSESDIAKEMYSMILSAKVTGRKVNIFSGECVSLGGATYNSITSVYMN